MNDELLISLVKNVARSHSQTAHGLIFYVGMLIV